MFSDTSSCSLQHYIVENARVQQFKDDLSKKDREIAMLRLSHEKLQVGFRILVMIIMLMILIEIIIIIKY